MANQYSSWDRFYQKINMIFNGIVASSMIPFAILFLQNQNQAQIALVEEPLFQILKISIISLSLLILVVANRMSSFLIRPVFEKETIAEKLDIYLIQKLKQLAIVEASAIVALIGFFLLKEQIFSFIYVGVLFIFSMYRPTFGRISKEINEPEEDLIKWSKEEAGS